MLTSRNLFRWIDEPIDAEQPVRFASSDAEWRTFSYGQLAARAASAASALHELGIRRSAVVAIVAPQGPDFLASLFGVLRIGAIPLPIAPLRAFENARAYQHHLCGIAEVTQPRMLLAPAALAESVGVLAERGIAIVTIESLVSGGGDAVAASAAHDTDLAMLQCTSGSSGRVRAVRVSYGALTANVEAIRRWLEWRDVDAAAFWIPPYHDMGLIGGVFAPLVSGCALWFLTPEQFVRRPLQYVDCFGRHAARLTAIPAFGLDYICRRIRPQDLAGSDFSSVKGFIIGAEPIRPATLTRFASLLEPFGLRSGTLLPAYGLAEATLAVTGLPLGKRWSTAVPTDGTTPVIGCGGPLGDVDVTIVDETGQPVSEGVVGQVVVRGTSISSGYLGGAAESKSTFTDRGLHTGDAGFVRDGQLFPLGRLGDSIKLRGRPLFAEALEGELRRLGHDGERNAVLLGLSDGRPTVVWITENAQDPRAGLDALARMSEGADLVAVVVRRGAIPRTSSGKPRRHVLWNAFVDNGLPGKVWSARTSAASAAEDFV